MSRIVVQIRTHTHKVVSKAARGKEDGRNEWILTLLPPQVFQSHRRQMLLSAPGTTLFYQNHRNNPNPGVVPQVQAPPWVAASENRHAQVDCGVADRTAPVAAAASVPPPPPEARRPIADWLAVIPEEGEEEDDPSYHRMRQKKIFVRAVACHNKEEDAQLTTGNCPTKTRTFIITRGVCFGFSFECFLIKGTSICSKCFFVLICFLMFSSLYGTLCLQSFSPTLQPLPRTLIK